ncbi:MAG: TPM domain-containing protein [Bacteroidales bacterium]|nr:TPM domain-containing protein [Bacteroidales bacterium]
MYRILLIIFSTLFLVACSDEERKWTPDNLTDPYTVDKTFVLDPAGYLDADQRTEINNLCDSLNTKADLETAIVVLDEIDMEPLDFGVKLYNNWRLGRDSRGLILLVVINQHRWQFITGYGAEADFPDVILGRIGNNIMVPEFREDRYANGIHKALSEIFKVATDHEYKASEYGVLDRANAVNNTSIEDDDKWSEGDWIACFITLLLCIPFIGIYIAYYGLNNAPLKSVESKIVIYENSECNVAYYSDNLRIAKWGFWDGKKGIWYLLFMGVFVWFLCEAFEYMDYAGGDTQYDDFMHFLPYVAGYFGFSAIIHAIIATYHLWSCKTSRDTLTRANAMSRSGKLKFYMIVAPYIAIPFYLACKIVEKKAARKVLKCPKCNGMPEKASANYSPMGEARQYEIREGIMKATLYTCGNGHNTALLMPTNKVKNYIFCKHCQAYSAKVTDKEEKVKAEFKKKGSWLYKAKCECCGCDTTETVIVPKLSKLYDISDESSFSGGNVGYNSGSYSSGGGSRGGGYSGGGGAGGRW